MNGERRYAGYKKKLVYSCLFPSAVIDTTALENDSNVVLSSSHSSSDSGNNLPVARKERDYKGMFKCRSKNITTSLNQGRGNGTLDDLHTFCSCVYDMQFTLMMIKLNLY